MVESTAYRINQNKKQGVTVPQKPVGKGNVQNNVRNTVAPPPYRSKSEMRITGRIMRGEGGAE